MKVLSWNVRKAHQSCAAWDYLLEAAPDVALLQEVGSIPSALREQFNVFERHAIGKSGARQRFTTAVITKLPIAGVLELRSEHPWVQEQAGFFRGNIVGATLIRDNGQLLHTVSVYSPAWAIQRDKWVNIDVTRLKLDANPDIWCTEILWDLLRTTIPTTSGEWLVAGDFNSSETFDFRAEGDRGNREIMNRMIGLGLTEVLRSYSGKLVPTFKQPRGSAGRKILHQLDHMYVSAPLSGRLIRCYTGRQEDIFGRSISDHLPVIAEFRDDLQRNNHRATDER